MIEDFPALGKPTSPTSATVFSSRMRSRCWPGSPLRANPGALRRGLARAALPSPPPPPAAGTHLLAGAARAGGGYEPAAGADEIGEDLAVRGLHLGPVRHRDDQVGAVGAGPVRTLALLAVTGPADRAAVEVRQGRRARVHFEDHIPAVAAVAPVRAAERLELLAGNRGAALPAVAGLHLQRDPVGELRHNAHLPQCM